MPAKFKVVDLPPEADADLSVRAHNQHSEPLHTWESPDWSILDDRRGDLPSFPGDCLGKAFTVVHRAAKGAGVTDAHVAVPMLGIASGLIGVARRVQVTTSWLEPCTMWCAVIGFSGTGKTPGLEVTKRALSEVERDKREKISELRRAHDSKAEKARAAREAWKKSVKDAVEAGTTAPDMPKEAQDPGKFIAPRLYVSDGTIERLGELLNARPQGITRILDELAGMFANMQRYSGGQDNEFWLEAWNGNSFSVERIGRQLEIDHLLVGVVGGFQPDKLVRAFAGDDDGMYARLNFAWPEEAPHNKLADQIGSVDPNLKRALAHLDGLAEFKDDGDLIGKAIKLSPAAREEFEGLRGFVNQQMNFLDGREREWLAKAPAHTLRLAGTLCLLDWAWDEKPAAEPSEIETLYVRRAIKLVNEYLWPHARAALRLAGLSDRHARARRALRWIRAKRLKDVALQDIRRDALGRAVDEAGAKELIDGLVRAGWLRPLEAKIGPLGGRPALRWSVNPLLVAETPETPETPTNGCRQQPEEGVSGVSGVSAKHSEFGQTKAADDGNEHLREPNGYGMPAVNGYGMPAVEGTPDAPDPSSDPGMPQSPRPCDYCGQLGTAADPVRHGYWRPHKPDGNWLHTRCKEAWQAGGWRAKDK